MAEYASSGHHPGQLADSESRLYARRQHRVIQYDSASNIPGIENESQERHNLSVKAPSTRFDSIIDSGRSAYEQQQGRPRSNISPTTCGSETGSVAPSERYMSNARPDLPTPQSLRSTDNGAFLPSRCGGNSSGCGSSALSQAGFNMCAPDDVHNCPVWTLEPRLGQQIATILRDHREKLRAAFQKNNEDAAFDAIASQLAAGGSISGKAPAYNSVDSTGSASTTDSTNPSSGDSGTQSHKESSSNSHAKIPIKIAIKTGHGTELRRTNLSMNSTFSALLRSLGIRSKSDQSTVAFSYMDEDDDPISVKNTADLQEAFQFYEDCVLKARLSSASKGGRRLPALRFELCWDEKETEEWLNQEDGGGQGSE